MQHGQLVYNVKSHVFPPQKELVFSFRDLDEASLKRENIIFTRN